MVWFQCEDCGENLKKPKLLNHFRICSASKLSCIDCGETFGQQSVQGHAQCITEAEKYGPKGQAKASNNTPAKPNKDSKQKPDIDINVGLSSRPPWFCSLCNTSATSRQTLLLHAEGKKHRAKARAFHASKQQPKQTEESIPNAKDTTSDIPKGESLCTKDAEEPKGQDQLKATALHNSSEAENGSLSSKKKRKLNASDDGGAKKKEGNDSSGDLSNGEVIQAKRAKAEESDKTEHVDAPEQDKTDKTGHTKEANKEKIKWKKLISSILKSNPDGALKMRKLQKFVLKALQESGVTEDAQLKDTLMHKINTSSRFTLDNKLVRLVAKS